MRQMSPATPYGLVFDISFVFVCILCACVCAYVCVRVCVCVIVNVYMLACVGVYGARVCGVRRLCMWHFFYVLMQTTTTVRLQIFTYFSIIQAERLLNNLSNYDKDD